MLTFATSNEFQSHLQFAVLMYALQWLALQMFRIHIPQAIRKLF